MGLFLKSKKRTGYLVIDFLDDGLCALRIQRTESGPPVVGFFAFFPGKPSISQSMLEKLAKEAQTAKYDCGTLLALNEYQILSIDAPNVPPDELKAAVRWRLKDMLDFHVNDATVDILDVPIDANAASRNHSMYAVVAKNQLIEQRQALFASAKIPLKVIDVPETAQRNVSVLLEPPGRGLALLSFHEKGGLLTVTFGGELYLSRRLDTTLEQLIQSDESSRQACYDRVTLELQRSLDHFDRQYHFIAVAKLMLAPMSNAGSGLQAYLSQNLYLPVEVLDLNSVLDFSKAQQLKSLEMQQRHLMAIGAALRQEEAAL